MADVAAISVVSSGAVGVLGVAGAIYGQRVTLRNAMAGRLEARRDDLRGVLDEAARIGNVAYRAIAALADKDVAPGDAFVGALNESIGPLQEQLARLGIRVGPKHPAYQNYADFAHGVGTLAFTARELRDIAAARPGAPEITKDDLEKSSTEAKQAFDRGLAAFPKFLEEATSLVGALSHSERAGRG